MPRSPAKPAATKPALRLAEPVALHPESTFAATPEQQAFQEVAIAEVDKAKGHVDPSTWFATYYGLYHTRISVGKFESWERDPAFVDWFYDPMRYKRSAHIDAIDMAVFHRRLSQGIATGDPKAMALFAQIKGLIKKPEAVTPEKTGIGEILEQFAADVPDDATNPWAAARPAAREQ